MREVEGQKPTCFQIFSIKPHWFCDIALIGIQDNPMSGNHVFLNRRRVIATAAALPLCLPCPGIAERAGCVRPYRIRMVTFDGPTASEQGFRDYLERRRIPLE